MLFAIRDDDTCFFTKPDELSEAYDFVKEGTISLSCIPYCFPYHKDTNPFQTNVDPGYYDIEDNGALVDYVRTGIEHSRFEIMLHGFSHEYKKISDKYQAEMIWKSKSQISDELTRGKKHLEDLFGVNIRTFVAPNNLVDKKCVSVLEDLGLNFSGTIWKRFGDRKCDRYYLRNYIHRTIYHCIYKMPFSGIYYYKHHLELYAHNVRNYDDAIRVFERCKQENHPFVVYNHYWDLNANPAKKRLMEKIYDFAMNNGCRLVPMSECFK